MLILPMRFLAGKALDIDRMEVLTVFKVETMPRVPWCLADAFALALDRKEENPALDFPSLVNDIWAWMEKENESISRE